MAKRKRTKSKAGKLYSRESQTLALIRDALLPKLLSGEIRVKSEGRVL